MSWRRNQPLFSLSCTLIWLRLLLWGHRSNRKPAPCPMTPFRVNWLHRYPFIIFIAGIWIQELVCFGVLFCGCSDCHIMMHRSLKLSPMRASAPSEASATSVRHRLLDFVRSITSFHRKNQFLPSPEANKRFLMGNQGIPWFRAA